MELLTSKSLPLNN